MMLPDLIPFATFRPISFYASAGKFVHTPYGWILHVEVGNGSPWSEFQHSVSPHRRFAHGWIAKSGAMEQYAPLSYMSWAQVNGNDDYWAFETEGFPEEPLNSAQIATLARLHNFLEASDSIASKPGDHGIGTHYMGGASWGGHSCPDPVGKEGQGPRSHQRQAILNLAVGQPPAPKPNPNPPLKGKKMLRLIQPGGPGKPIYVTDGMTIRWIHAAGSASGSATLDYYQALLAAYGYDNNYHNQDPTLVQSYGELIGPDAPDSVIVWPK